jgi:sensor domain CHASE-containing protein
MDFSNKSKFFLWSRPVFMLVLFLAAFAAVICLVHLNTSRTRQVELVNSTVSVSDSMRLRLKGNEDYLLMLAKNRSDGSLNSVQFRERASNYVHEHPEIINITWVDADFFIRDVAPLAPNRQIVGLHLDLPEPKRVSQLAKEKRRPIYTRPFEAIQGKPSFEIWVPVFNGDNFLGLFAGVYSCDGTLRHLFPKQNYPAFHASLVDAAGRVLSGLPKSGPVDETLVQNAPLTPDESGVVLRLGSYGLGRLGWTLQILEFLCLALVLGMAYAIWSLNREVMARKETAKELNRKTVQLEDELAARQITL